MKSELTFCPNCDEELMHSRVAQVVEDQQLKDYEDGYKLIDEDGEIQLCSDCQEWDDADDYKGEGWD
jgi:hypothetical protein